MRLGTVQYHVPNLSWAGDFSCVGFRKTGELVALSSDSKVYVWPADGSTRPTVQCLLPEPQFARYYALSPDARYAVTVYEPDYVVRVWDLTGPKPVEYLKRKLGDTRVIQFSHDGTWLAVRGHDDQTSLGLFLCRLATKEWSTFTFNRQGIGAVAFTPDDKRLLVRTWGDVRLIDLNDLREVAVCKIPLNQLSSVALSPDGKSIAHFGSTGARGANAKIRVSSFPDAADLAEAELPRDSVNYWIDYTRDGKRIYLGSITGVQEWDVKSNRHVRTIPGSATVPPVYSPDGKKFATHGGAGILLWDLTKQALVRPDLVDAGHSDRIGVIAVSPDGKRVATTGMDRQLRFWDADTGRMLARIPSRDTYIRNVVFLPDSKSVLTTVEDSAAPIVCDPNTGQIVRRFSVDPAADKSEAHRNLRLSADGRHLLTTTMPFDARQQSFSVKWDVATGKEIARKPFMGRDIIRGDSIESPDGMWQASLSGLVRAQTGEVRIRESGMISTFSPDSRYWVNGGMTRLTALYDLATLKRIDLLQTGNLHMAAFSPDGRYLAVAAKGKVALWDMASLKEVRSYPTDPVNVINRESIAFHPDGRRVITGQPDGTALVWDFGDVVRVPGTPVPPATDESMQAWWESLAKDDAAAAYRAGWELADRPKKTLPFLRDRLKPVPPADAKTVANHVEQLDASVFVDRETAERALTALGETAVTQLKEAVKGNLSPEQRSRIKRIIAAYDATGPTTDWFRKQRAVAILERIATSESRKLLTDLAAGTPDAWLTQEAKASLARMR
jgi:WD40 repeat protein